MDTPVHPVDLIAEAAVSLHRPSWDEYFMATAVLLATRSSCERLNVGCVIVTGGSRKNRIVAAGYNGFLPDTGTSRVRDGHEQATVHAEQNALADAARRGSSVEGCVAYVTHFPCLNCAKILAAGGIVRSKREVVGVARTINQINRFSNARSSRSPVSGSLRSGYTWARRVETGYFAWDTFLDTAVWDACSGRSQRA